MSKREAVKKLEKLTKSSNEFYDEFYGIRIIKVPENYEYPESEISISGQFYMFYDEFMEFLKSEEELEYMVNNSEGRQFVEDELHKFILDILLNEKYHQGKELKIRINELLESLYKPFEKYKVVIPIECFSTNIPHEFEIEDSLISKLDLAKLKKDAVDSSELFENFFKHWDNFENYYCVSVYESGNNPNFVVERARKKASKCIDVLRLYFYETNFRTFAAKYFVANECAFLFDSEGKFKGFYGGWDERKPINEVLSEEYVSVIYECINKLKKVNLIENTKTKYQIDRTIYWLGKAISEPDFDVSLVLYCSALESLLIPETEGKKAEALALRIALTEKMKDKNLSNPFVKYKIYINRSKVVHGAAHKIISEADLIHLEWVIPRILYSFIDFASANPQMKPSDLIKKLENFEDCLVVFSHLFLHSGEFEHFVELSEYIMNEKLLQGAYIKVTKKGVEILSKVPDEILEKFFQATNSDNFGVKFSAVFSLGFLKESSAVKLLNSILLSDDNIEIRKCAALSLGRIKDPISIKLLIQTLYHEDKSLKEASAKALGWIGSPIATEALIKSLADNEAEVRQASARALGDIGDKRAFQPLIDALEDNDPDVISSVSIALGKFKNREAIIYLKIAKKKKIVGTQKAIDWALNEINKNEISQ